MSDRERRTLHDLFLQYKSGVVPVFVVSNAGDAGVGTAFHVGGSTFVTARHVLENTRSVEVLGQKLERFFFHKNPSSDVAVFRLSRAVTNIAVLPLGGHLDDWMSDDDFMLNRALVLGYPPIPMTREPHLVAATAEVNAIIGLPGDKHPHFVISAMARGGFSGGPVISEWDFVLGLTSCSLVRNGEAEQLGFFTVFGIEPIYECLADNDLLPDEQNDEIGSLFKKSADDAANIPSTDG